MLNYLYSIRDRHVADIMNGDKTFELRTKIPREMKEAIDKGEKVIMWIYCTKGGKRFVKWNGIYMVNDKYVLTTDKLLNGLVVAKCVVDSYEEVSNRFNGNEWVYDDWLLNVTCLDENQLDDYLKQDGNYRFGYAIHLTQVEMLDKPLQVGEFYSYKVIHKPSTLTEPITDDMPFDKKLELLKQCESYTVERTPLTRAPQSYQKVKAPEGKE